ncbi:MAG: insulinase family protein [Desulfobacterales bacterium]|nr:insulinase family protein [Desulfobacterales bacterium]
MNTVPDKNNPDILKGSGLSGYDLKGIVPLQAIDSICYQLEHTRTGARHIHISNNDKENTFSVAFKTVPKDSTGVAHILEHTVLCGSRKFPVRDPFFSMLKRSLSTFMNAFTSSDWTMYPFSTQNGKDFQNLMDVYLDAVFFPNIDELSFKQEGHRLEIEGGSPGGESGQLVYKGVVYNEMKGAMSSPDQVFIRSLFRSVYPLTTYSFNSGGDPSAIPDLTYDQLMDFHRRHYHPSNAFFYTYGNLPLSAHLAFIQDKILKNFQPIDPQTEVPSHARWSEPKTATHFYPFSKTEDPSGKAQICLAWLTADIKDPFEVMALSLLEQILMGNSGSPLRKALIDSGLGSALCDGAGFMADNRDTLFICGLKDVGPESAARIEKIVFDVLESLVAEGIDRDLIESAIHQMEFHRKEITNHPYPYGIKLLLSICASWFHGADPTRALRFDADIDRLRDQLAANPFFEDRIEKYFLKNPHRIRFTLSPDQLMEERENREIFARLKQIRAKMTPSDLEKIRQDERQLRSRQESVEDVSCLPTLRLSDIPPEVNTLTETSVDEPNGVTYYHQPTAGIMYFVSTVGTAFLPEKFIPLVPFFCRAFTKTGTRKHGYTEMAKRIDACTGGVNLSASAMTSFDGTDACMPFVTFNGKCLTRNRQGMFEIIEELLLEFDFSNIGRLKQLLLEYRADLESAVVQNGHRLALSSASRNFSPSRRLSETWFGIRQVQTAKNMTLNLSDDKLNDLAGDLSAMADMVFTRKNMKIALIGEEQSVSASGRALKSIQSRLKEGEGSGYILSDILQEGGHIPREGWSTSTAVSFVAQTFPTVRMAHADAPALTVISKLLRSLYLHREIREKGGAYGGFALYNMEEGFFGFASYRDPHIISTLRAFDGAAAFLTSGTCNARDIEEAILQVCSEIDKPNTPAVAAKNAFYRKIVSLTDEKRNDFKRRLLSLTLKHVQDVAEKYFSRHRREMSVAVISGEDKLKLANEKLADHPLKLFRI